ncbi:MAG TPA: alpha/beta fold hydrolase [Naasia sp.]
MRIDPTTVRWSVPEGERAAELARRGLVVLLHGRYGTEDTLAGFASAFDAVVATPRGPQPHGDKYEWFQVTDEWPLPDAPLADLTGAFVAWLDSLDVERAAFVGFSQGGATVAEFAVRHPERVIGAVVIDGFAPSAAPPDDRVPPPLLVLRGEDDDVVEDLLPAFLDWLPASAVQRVYPGVGHIVTPGQMADAAAWLRGDLPGTRREER